ncbi:uncharacterized protein LOC141705373 [Apium graveolens]|uniref:uncharacterized protein LOC141705373 n=1 Tax=Apium graveolens TaxID=4045 RepID=UPI003D796795
MWETCDNMEISWITSNLSPAICKSVIYMHTSKEIWNNLELSFSLTNGSRKYKLNKSVYELKQHTMSVTDYHTSLKTIWEELDAMNVLPTITALTSESHILLTTPLPSVETAIAMLQQEEAQRDLFTNKDSEHEILAMYSKGQPSKVYNCTACGAKGHTADRCSSVIGYPKWHLQYKGPGATPLQKPTPRNNSGNMGPFRGKWSKNNRQQPFRTANAAQASDSSSSDGFSTQQLSQLAQLMQLSGMQSNTSAESTDVLESPFSGMMSCNAFVDDSATQSHQHGAWIIDSGASDHMTTNLSNLVSPVAVTSKNHINLPTGATEQITHTGTAILPNGLHLFDVLCVPYFKHNLLSVQKLIKHTNVEVKFLPTHCIILDVTTQAIKSVGEAKHGLYYLVHTDKPTTWLSKFQYAPACLNANSNPKSTPVTVWHHRLGHAPLSKINLIPEISTTKTSSQICVTCPMAKFTKLPFTLSDSHAHKIFDLVHIDIWGPYKVCTKGNMKYFMTIVDDKSRHTWVSLLRQKSEAFPIIEAFCQYAEK